MSNLKASKRNRFRLTVLIGVLLLVLGVSLWGYSIYTIQEREQMLKRTDLTLEETFAYEGALDWWKTIYNNVFFPLSVIFLLLGFIALVYQPLSNRLNHKPTRKTFTSSRLPTNQTMNDFILQIVAEKKPETVEQLAKLVQQKFNCSEEEILDLILLLQSEGKIMLKKPSVATTTFPKYLISGKANWYWLTLIFTVVTTVIVLQIPEGSYPMVYVRYALGYSFVLLLPGYALIKALFPAGLDAAERIGLSIGTSIALVCLDAFFLNFTPSGIELSKLVMSLLVMILAFATIGVIRIYANEGAGR